MKKNIKWVIFSFVVLFILPFLAAKFAGSNGMALCFIMFFTINPIFFVAEGITFGKEIKKYWFMPLVSALIYLLSMWVVFDMGETAFIMYSGIYLAIGIVVMLITFALNHRKEKYNERFEKSSVGFKLDNYEPFNNTDTTYKRCYR